MVFISAIDPVSSDYGILLMLVEKLQVLLKSIAYIDREMMVSVNTVIH